MEETRKVRSLGLGALGAALVSSACCAGPLLLASLGLGGGAVLLGLEPYRPFFTAATALLLGGAFYLTYRRKPARACDAACGRPAARQKLFLWTITGLVIVALAVAQFGDVLF